MVVYWIGLLKEIRKYSIWQDSELVTPSLFDSFFSNLLSSLNKIGL